MVLTILQYGGLHALHWLISALVPLLLLLIALLYSVQIFRIKSKVITQLQDLATGTDAYSGRSMANWPGIEEMIRTKAPSRVQQAAAGMTADSQTLYQNRWLPDPRSALPLSRWLSEAQLSSVSWRPPARILAAGILAALVSLLVQEPLPIQSVSLRLPLTLLPLLVSVAAALPLAASARHTLGRLEEQLNDFFLALGRHVPVFGEQSGLAHLIDGFLDYDRHMQAGLDQFTATAGRLAESDMADGIRRSVEQVLTESVAPSLQQAALTLGRLATELTDRQEQGMHELAGRFAQALSAELAAHMHPINREIAQMASLMADVKNYMEVAMRAMDTFRQESDQALQDLGQALAAMADARSSLSDDFSVIRDHLATMTASTGQLGSLLAGNSNNLAAALTGLKDSLEARIDDLGHMTAAAIQTAEDARQAAATQEVSLERHVTALTEQTTQYRLTMQEEISRLLQQIRHETATVAAVTADLGKRMNDLNERFGGTLEQFTQGSAAYVKDTLHQFDEGLADIVSRLAETALAIQDAVDALPAAIQRSAQYDT